MLMMMLSVAATTTLGLFYLLGRVLLKTGRSCPILYL
jgi:hypothetical protein